MRLASLFPEDSAAGRTDRVLAFFVLRLTLGINLLLHGLVRIPKLTGFADTLVQDFDATILPAGLVRAFALALPWVEALTGALLVLGLWTRWALVLGGLTIAMLVFGSALREQWDTVGTQMIYAIVYYLLLAHRRFDRISVDALLAQRRS